MDSTERIGKRPMRKSRSKKTKIGSPVEITWFDAFTTDDPGPTFVGTEMIMEEIGYFWGENEKYIYIVREINREGEARFAMGIPLVNVIKKVWL